MTFVSGKKRTPFCKCFSRKAVAGSIPIPLTTKSALTTSPIFRYLTMDDASGSSIGGWPNRGPTRCPGFGPAPARQGPFSGLLGINLR